MNENFEIDMNIMNIIRGNFKQVPEPNSSTIKIFLSSTFSGAKIRKIL